MLKASTLFAMLAALMLIMAGVPASASASPCDPCPPDCPMMAQMAKAAASADQDKHPDKGGKGDNPCKQGLTCASMAAPVALSEQATEQVRFAEAVPLYVSGVVGGPSHPPDPGLRPPIQL